jgi:hypothetical protein
MAAKPQTEAGYNPAGTELAERVLLEVWSRLGEFRQYLVLVGGLVPRYLVKQPPMGTPGVIPAHKGTLDVDLAISLAVADVNAYEKIHATLVDTLGFTPGQNPQGRDQRHSFKKRVGHADVILDFLTTKYDGPKNSLMRVVEENLSAIQVEGLGLALRDPLVVEVEGELLEHGRYAATINVCRPIPFLVLKALALAGRSEPKDAYDLVYILRYYAGGDDSFRRIEPSVRETGISRHAADYRAVFPAPDAGRQSGTSCRPRGQSRAPSLGTPMDFASRSLKSTLMGPLPGQQPLRESAA